MREKIFISLMLVLTAVVYLNSGIIVALWFNGLFAAELLHDLYTAPVVSKALPDLHTAQIGLRAYLFGVSGIGLVTKGPDYLNVYVRNENIIPIVPENFNGIPVKCTVEKGI